MPGNETGSPTWAAQLLGKGFLAACGVIVTLCGVVIGLWSHGIEKDLVDIRDSQRAIWATLNDRATIGPRTAELEKRTDDQEDRLRAIEKQTYRNGH